MNSELVSNCLLCGEHGLHVLGEGKEQMFQCLNCGYMSNEQLNGKSDNEFFKEMGETIKVWAKYTEDRIWIPVQLTLPIGALYPVNINGDMKWAFAKIIDIPENEQKKPDKSMLKDEKQLYNKKFDEDNPEIYDTFLDGFAMMNDMLKKIAENSDG
tara:strand:+ start:75 stop:542 length:468 start_codon:yes stop_codon:yes gene_type:complete